MNIERVKYNIQYAYPEMPYMSEYYNLKSALLNSASEDVLNDIETNGKNAVNSWARDFYENRAKASRKIVDGTRTREKVLPYDAIEILNNIRAKETLDALEASGMKEGVYDVVLKGYRTGVIEICGMAVSRQTRFILRSSMLAYGDERYSLAFKSQDGEFGFALIAESGDRGKSGILKVSYFNADSYFVDDASKYMEVEPFVKGLS
jgi:hypothetical protein